MDYNGYLAARSLVGILGQPVIIGLLTLSFILIPLALFRKGLRYGRGVVLATLLLLLLGFGFLIWFHFKIYNTIALLDPTTGEIAGRYRIPLWVEQEKLYFWALFLGLLTLFINPGGNPKKRYFATSLYIVFAGFIILTALASNPFNSPLPQFHQQITTYNSLLSQGKVDAMSPIYHQLHGQLIGYYNSAYMWIHPPLLFIAYSPLVISFIASIFMLIYRHEKDYDNLAYNYAKFGYFLLTIGILVGYPWTISAWKGQPWWWSPKINMSLMMWVLYSAYLHSRLYLHRRGMWNTTAILGIVCFLALVFTYLTTYLVPGIHSYR